jgi:hypothetical protein
MMTFEEIKNFYMLSDSDEILLVWLDGVAGWIVARFAFDSFILNASYNQEATRFAAVSAAKLSEFRKAVIADAFRK